MKRNKQRPSSASKLAQPQPVIDPGSDTAGVFAFAEDKDLTGAKVWIVYRVRDGVVIAQGLKRHLAANLSYTLNQLASAPRPLVT